MSEVTISEYAKILNISANLLVEQLESAGIVCAKGVDHSISEEEKRRLLEKLKMDHGGDETKKNVAQFVMTRESISELKVPVSGSTNKKTVKVVVKQSRKFIKDLSPPPEVIAVEASVAIEAIETPIAEPNVSLDSEEPIARIEPEAIETPAVIARVSMPNEGALKDKKAKEKPSKERTYSKAAHTPNKDVHKKHFQKKDYKSRESVPVKKHAFEKPQNPMVRDVCLSETISVSDLAQQMSVKVVEVIKVMMKMGVMATINQIIDQDTATLVVEEMGHNVILKSQRTVEDHLQTTHDADAVTRAPIVTIMGHVDHGKTSLLDYIRRTKVALGEAGGITQHIGAYHVDLDRGSIAFLDTPGHAAFSAMRARGAKCTDIVVIVVAADDGVKPQTVEAIMHAKAANVPIIIALNKMDKNDIDIERVKTELAQHDILSEEWGGETIFVPVSAKTGEGVDKLLESILLQAELLELTAQVHCPASGVVVESRIDKGRGPVSTVLVQNGTLKQGDIVLAGVEYGRVRTMYNEVGAVIREAGPSIPVEVLGLSGAPQAGDELIVVLDEKKAREIALFRQGKFRDIKLARQHASKLEGFMDKMQEGEIKTLAIVLKADVQGSVEALVDTLHKISHPEVKVKVVSKGVGGINESDVNLALASHAILVGFNVRADAVARRLAEKEGLSLNYYSIIYDLCDAVKAALSGMIGPKYTENILGVAQVREVYRSSKFGSIAGCMVMEGVIKRNKPIRVLRDQVVIYEGALESLRRYKEDMTEVKQGIECGIGVKNYNDVRAGDQIEVFEKVEMKQELISG